MQRSWTARQNLATGAIAFCLIFGFFGPASAQREPQVMSGAEHIRSLVINQRAEVLARIDAILTGKRHPAQQSETAATDETGADAAKPESGEEAADAADGEMEEISEPESDEEDAAETADEDVLELPETGSGVRHGPSNAAAMLAIMSGLAAIGLRGRGIRRVNPVRPG